MANLKKYVILLEFVSGVRGDYGFVDFENAGSPSEDLRLSYLKKRMRLQGYKPQNEKDEKDGNKLKNDQDDNKKEITSEAKYKCLDCDGVGWFDDNSDDKCETCSATGFVDEEPAEDDEELTWEVKYKCFIFSNEKDADLAHQAILEVREFTSDHDLSKGADVNFYQYIFVKKDSYVK